MKNEQILEGNDCKYFLGYYIYPNGKIIGKKGKELKTRKGTSGYWQAIIYDNKVPKTYLIHRLVAMLFVDNPKNKPEVNHIDGNKDNNLDKNLEWCTRSENIKHGFKNGLIKKSMLERTGAKHWRSKPILALDVDGNVLYKFESSGDAERKEGFNRNAVCDALSGKLKTYKNLIWKYDL